MDREIRFRGKSLDDGSWVYGCLIHDKCGTMSDLKDRAFIAPTLPTENTYGNLWLTYMIEVDPKTVGEYSGSFDKKLNPIYEGDILRHNNGEVHAVEFEGYQFYFKNSFMTLFSPENYEVIGNIYDNVELLLSDVKDESEEQD